MNTIKNIFLLLIFTTSGLHAQDMLFKEDVQKLMKVMGVPERIDAMREYERMWTKPEKEAEYMPMFESTIPDFLQNVETYYINKYTHDEVKELLQFYNSPLGKKVTANAAALNEAYSKAKDVYGDLFDEVYFKYRKK